MINFEALKITDGAALHSNDWNELVDTMHTHFPPNLTEGRLELKIEEKETIRLVAEKETTSANAKTALGFYIESNPAGTPKKIMSINEHGNLVVEGNLRVNTHYGYLDVRPTYTGASFLTSSSHFYFNKEIRVDTGKIGTNNEDLIFAIAGEEKMRIKKRTNPLVGIGINAPKTTLHVSGSRIRMSKKGDVNHYIDIRADGSALDVESSKDLYLNNNGKQVYYRNMKKVSSRKEKKEIEQVSLENAIALLKQLNPVKYRYKTDCVEKPQWGFIAEEMPDEIAALDKASINPMDIIAILCKVLQDHQKKLAQI